MARAPLRATPGANGFNKRTPLRLIDYWPLVPCLTVLLLGYTEYRQRSDRCATVWVPSDRVSSQIPRIIHQSWKTGDVPERFHEWVASWKRLHPQWEYRLWTDAQNRRLIAEHYPWFLETFDALPKNIMRADAVRPFYMHRHGGMYADLDMEALRDLTPLLAGATGPVLAALSANWTLRHNIPNAWMASPPGHPFWQFCMAHTLRAFRKDMTDAQFYNEGIEKVTGPVALMEATEAYSRITGRNVTVLAPGLVFAYNWHQVTWCRTDDCILRVQLCSANEATFNSTACKEHYPDAYAITYWAHTWGDDPASKAEHAKREAAAKAGTASAVTEDAAAVANAAARADPAVTDPAATAGPLPAAAATTQDAAASAALPEQLPVTGVANAATAESTQVAAAAVDDPAQGTASVQTAEAQARL